MRIRYMGKVVLSMALLIAGGGIYLLQRTTSLLMFRLVDILGMTHKVEEIRASAVAMPEFLVFCLPGGLWSASYVLLVDAVMAGQPAVTRLAWGALIPMIGLVSELLQAVGLCPGTADWRDAVCYGVPYLLYVLWVKVAAGY